MLRIRVNIRDNLRSVRCHHIHLKKNCCLGKVRRQNPTLINNFCVIDSSNREFIEAFEAVAFLAVALKRFSRVQPRTLFNGIVGPETENGPSIGGEFQNEFDFILKTQHLFCGANANVYTPFRFSKTIYFLIPGLLDAL